MKEGRMTKDMGKKKMKDHNVVWFLQEKKVRTAAIAGGEN